MLEREKIELVVNGCKAEKFISYEVSHSIYEPEGSFHFVADSQYNITKGETCKIYVDGKLVLTGIIDTVKRGLTRNGPTMEISGRSVASILADTSITDFKTYPKAIKALVERLVKGLPFISRKDFQLLGDSAKQQVNREFVKVSPGDTVFDVIRNAVNSKGYLFWVSPDGAFIVDKPKESGSPNFLIQGNLKNVNYLEGSVEDSLLDVHSSITVRGECQNAFGETSYVKSTIERADLPFKKPLVVAWNENEGPVKKAAALKMAVEKAGELKLEYTFPGHSQNGKVWTVNEFAKVQDEYNGAIGNFLIVSRTFSLSRSEGRRTTVRLEKGGRL